MIQLYIDYMGKTENWGNFVASKNSSEVTIKEEENHLMGLVHWPSRAY